MVTAEEYYSSTVAAGAFRGYDESVLEYWRGGAQCLHFVSL